MSNTKVKYRNWIRSRHGSLHKDDSNDKYKSKKWRIGQKHIIETIIEEYAESGFKPAYLVTRNYFYDQQDRQKVVEHNDRMNRVLDDFFNPRGSSEYFIMHDHFIERHKDKLVKKESKRPVLNTLTNEVEFDFSNVEIKKGGFHVHTLISEIDDDVIFRRNRKIQKAVEKIYGLEEIPISLTQDEWGISKVKMDLIEHSIRDRCDFVGNSTASIDIQPVNEFREYDGYTGWKGMIAYACKMMYNVDNMVEIYDSRNNSILSN